MRCYAAAAIHLAAKPAKIASQPPVAPITEDMFAIAEELSPFDTLYRHSSDALRILNNATLTPQIVFMRRVDAQCDYGMVAVGLPSQWRRQPLCLGRLCQHHDRDACPPTATPRVPSVILCSTLLVCATVATARRVR